MRCMFRVSYREVHENGTCWIFGDQLVAAKQVAGLVPHFLRNSRLVRYTDIWGGISQNLLWTSNRFLWV
jgi:hypothetical protein